MNGYRIHWAAAFSLVLVLTTSIAMALEEARYSVIGNFGDFEVRRYRDRIVAETVVEGDFDQVGNEGFRRLFSYISGKNSARSPIPMTAPVTQEPAGERIPMTAPVTQTGSGGSWTIAFVMPSSYTMETLPEPADERIALRTIAGETMAALRYSGTWSRKRYERHRARLLALLEERGIEVAGEDIYARYNPPFMPWFLRRNEVLIPVKFSSP